MGILSDVEIRKLCVEEEMISPFADIEEKKQSKKDGKMSYGLDGSGYDIRIQNSYEVLKSNIQRKDIDPKSKDDSVYERKSAINGVIVVPALGVIIGVILLLF